MREAAQKITVPNLTTVKPRVAVEAREQHAIVACTYIAQGYANGQPDPSDSAQGLFLITTSGSGTAWPKSAVPTNYQTNFD